MTRLTFRWLWFLFLLLSAESSPCAGRFILRAPPALVPAIAARHSLIIGTPANNEGVSAVSTSDSRTPAAVVAEVVADPDVQGFEIDQSTLVAESVSGIQLNQSTAVILDAAAPQVSVSYFGGDVWKSYVQQPATVLTRLEDAQKSATGTGVVAIIDTGVDPDQPVLIGSLVPGYDFVHNTVIGSEWNDLDASVEAVLDPSSVTASGQNVVAQVNQSTAVILDQSTAVILDNLQLPAAFGHGTMVAGIVHLVAPTAQIMPLKAFSDDGSANLSDIVRAIYYAADNGAQVINMSFSLPSPSTELAKAIDYATGQGVACVASVGNGGTESVEFPAGFHNVFGVASTSNLDVRSTFSNFGGAVTQLAAPGEGIVTLYPGGLYAVASGTSFAAPFVTGAFTLLKQIDPDLKPIEALAAFSKVKRLTPELGFGRLDLYEAVQYLLK